MHGGCPRVGGGPALRAGRADGSLDPLREAPPTPEWSKIRVLGRVPEGVGKCAFLLGTAQQKPQEWVEFREPYLGVLKQAP